MVLRGFERSPARLQFQQKIITFEFPDKISLGENRESARWQSLSPPAFPFVTTFLGTDLLLILMASSTSVTPFTIRMVN